MKLKYYLTGMTVFLFSLLFLSGQNQTLEPMTPRELLTQIQDYVVYYNIGELETLKTFDLAIIQPETLQLAELQELKQNGTIVIAYLSLGEAETYRSWFNQVENDWILGENSNWGSLFIDTRQLGWQNIIIEQMGIYLENGFDGIFMDTIDTVDAYPDTTDGMIDLIQRLRTTYPDSILIQNRGFTILPRIQDLIDGLMFEGLVTGYNFETQTYTRVDNSQLALQLQSVKEETGITILALDYVEPGDNETALFARTTANEYGFVSSVAEISLQSILTFDWDSITYTSEPVITSVTLTGNCPDNISASVRWLDINANIRSIEVAYGIDANGVDGAFPVSYEIDSSETTGIWASKINFRCNNQSGGSCNFRFRLEDNTEEYSDYTRTTFICP
jgi:uncharacterized protein (TIGR01370 family)